MKHPSKVVQVGDQVEAVVLEVKPKDRRVSLGMKQLEADPWTTVAERYSIGSRGGRPRAQADRFRRIYRDRGRHRRSGPHLRSVMDEASRASLGDLEEGPDWCRPWFCTSTPRTGVCRWASNSCSPTHGRPSSDASGGRCRSGKVVPRVELRSVRRSRARRRGLCHNSEIPYAAIGGKAEPPLPIGEEFDFKIIKLNEAEKKIGLSCRGAAEDRERNRA